ncbi:hypothetical protein CsSME_00031652 [Camellia sinensis var. sinensis]
MYLATGLGIGRADASAGSVEEYYKSMVGEEPSNPLFLRNYAQLLQSKGDLHGAEEYYFRATLADPKDGEILLLYAKLVWKLHQDQDRALNYFKRAAPEDSHVLAAYACFLWEIKEDKEDCSVNDHTQIEEDDKVLVEVQKTPFEEEKELVSPSLHLAIGVGIDVAVVGGIDGVACNAADFGKGGNTEDYYKRMVEENPSNRLFLRNYAQFLDQQWRTTKICRNPPSTNKH